MSLTATLLGVDTDGDSIQLQVRLECPGLAPMTKIYNFRSVSQSEIASSIKTIVDPIESLVTRGFELRQAVGNDCFVILTGSPNEHLEAILESVVVGYDVVATTVRVTHTASGRSVLKAYNFHTAEQMATEALAAHLLSEGDRLTQLNNAVVDIAKLTDTDLAAWAREQN